MIVDGLILKKSRDFLKSSTEKRFPIKSVNVKCKPKLRLFITAKLTLHFIFIFLMQEIPFLKVLNKLTKVTILRSLYFNLR